MSYRFIRPLAALALASIPLAAAAQTAQFYTPPKVVKQGTTSSPMPKGAVTLKVFVKRDGTVASVEVKKSTNPADNAAAVEIAKSSTYRPGAKDGKPGDYFYTMQLKFDGRAAQTNSAGPGAPTAAGEIGQINALLRANKYDDARTQAQAYLSTHPGDKTAAAMLGVADNFLNKSGEAAQAFDQAGDIPVNFRAVAATAYGDAAAQAIRDKNYDQAVAWGSRAVAVQPENANAYYVRGTAYSFQQKYGESLADLQRARQIAGDKADQRTRDSLDVALLSAYLNAGQGDKALALAADIKRREPGNTSADIAVGNYYQSQAATAIKAGKRDDAVTSLEAAAARVPSQAASLYTAAANVLANDPKPDWKRVKAETDKGLTAAPNDPRLLFLSGVALANQGQNRDAKTALDKAKANVGADAALAKQIDDSLAVLAKQGVK